MKSNAKTVDDYLRQLPPDCREAIATVRQVILKNLPAGLRGIYELWRDLLPSAARAPAGNLQRPAALHAALASQKNFMTVYLMNVYGHKPTEKWFREGCDQQPGRRLLPSPALLPQPLPRLRRCCLQRAGAGLLLARRRKDAGMKTHRFGATPSTFNSIAGRVPDFGQS